MTNDGWYEVEAGIDYLRQSYPKTPEGRKAVSDLFGTLNTISKGRGENAVPKYEIGYEGHGARDWFVGYREADTLVRISGALADTVYNRWPHHFRTPARIDTQVTFISERQTSETLAEIYAQAVSASKERKKAHQFLVNYHGSIDGLETLYIGSRESEQFARIYDKHAKSPKDYAARTFRLEVQFENRFAREIVALIESVVQPSSLTCRDITLLWCGKRGVVAPSNVIYQALPLPTYQAGNTDTAAKVRWLETQVRPTVKLLQEYVSRVTLLHILGLDDEQGLE